MNAAIVAGVVVAVVFALIALLLRVPIGVVIVVTAFWGSSALIGGVLVLVNRIEPSQLRNGTVDVVINGLAAAAGRVARVGRGRRAGPVAHHVTRRRPGADGGARRLDSVPPASESCREVSGIPGIIVIPNVCLTVTS